MSDTDYDMRVFDKLVRAIGSTFWSKAFWRFYKKIKNYKVKFWFFWWS
jgi:hypothetical protein